MNLIEFEVGTSIVIPGMSPGKLFDPAVLLKDEGLIKYYLQGLFYNKILKGIKPFTYLNDIELLPVSVFHPNRCPHDVESWASLKEVEGQDFFERRIKLSDEELLWLIYSLIKVSNEPKLENPVLLNKGEFASYLIDLERISIFQLIGDYGTKRKWNCATFVLSKLSKEEKNEQLINKVLIPIKK